MLPLNLKSGVPIWEQIKEEFKKQILMGVWSPGEQLPSVRNLASELGINPNTIQRSYSELEREGFTFTVAGRGCFVEDNIELIQTKRRTEAIQKLESVLAELKEINVEYEIIVEKLNKIYKEGNEND